MHTHTHTYVRMYVGVCILYVYHTYIHTHTRDIQHECMYSSTTSYEAVIAVIAVKGSSDHLQSNYQLNVVIAVIVE